MAAKHANRLLQGMWHNLDGASEVQAVPWPFHLLADEEWQPLANEDAEKADLLIIATSELHPPTPAVLRWFEATIGRMRGTDAAIVSLRSPEANPHGGGPAFQEAIRSAAQQAGLAYFSTIMQLNHEEICQRLQHRADMMTPVMDKILHQPTSMGLTGANN
ncbi:MAG: hypothetical protein ACO1QS_05305 [Verrucomicrobiota bacterium]